MASVIIPETLVRFTSDQRRVIIQAPTLGKALIELIRSYPDLRGQLFDENLRLRGYVNIYLDQHAIELPKDFATPIHPNTVVRILQSVAGG